MKAAANGAPQSYALVIGLGEVDPNQYRTWDGKDATCAKDAQDMATFARERGFLLFGEDGTASKNHPPLLTEHATHANVVSIMHRAAETLSPDDLFLVYFSGHGGKFPKDGDWGELWTLYDAPLHDDEWDRLLCLIPEGVKVVVVSDSCWSAGFGPPEELDPPGLADIKFTTNSLDLCAAARAGKSRAVPAKVGKALEKAKSDSDIANEIPATVLLLAACQSNQQAYSGKTNGVFTEALLEVTREQPDLSYKSLLHEIRKKMTCPLQSPFHWEHGAGAYAFWKETSFSVAAPASAPEFHAMARATVHR